MGDAEEYFLHVTKVNLRERGGLSHAIQTSNKTMRCPHTLFSLSDARVCITFEQVVDPSLILLNAGTVATHYLTES